MEGGSDARAESTAAGCGAGDTGGAGGAGGEGRAGETADVVIVGAGAAGLACARRLRERGASCLLLEARERVGGRVHTVELGEFHVDLGAAYLHGDEGNPLGALLSEAGLSADSGLVSVAPANPWMHPSTELYVMYTPELRMSHSPHKEEGASHHHAVSLEQVPGSVVEASVMSAAIDAYRQLFEAVAPLAARCYDNNVSILHAMQQVLGESPFAELSREVRAVLDVLLWGVECWMGAKLSNLQLMEFAMDGFWGDYPGHHRAVTAGMGTAIETLSVGADVRLCTAVTEVDTTGDHVVLSATDTRSNKSKTYSARAVVVTAPLGVLQSGDIAFKPPLPTAMSSSLHRLAMGSYVKVFLAFEECFWPAEPAYLACVDVYSPCDDDGGRLRFPVFNNYQRTKGIPVLVGVLVGPDAETAAGRDDAEVVAAAVAALRVMLGRRIPDPTHTLVTHWGTDRWSKGAYSYAPLGCPPEDYDELLKPVRGKDGEGPAALWLAGEALDGEHMGSVHAALTSGGQVADSVADALAERRAAL